MNKSLRYKISAVVFWLWGLFIFISQFVYQVETLKFWKIVDGITVVVMIYVGVRFILFSKK